jgi:hypothetical protein
MLNRSEPEQIKRLYWDGGPKAIERFVAHHLKVCEQNVICNALSLRTVEFDDEDGGLSGSCKLVSPRRSPLQDKKKGKNAMRPLRIGWED